MSDEIKCPQCHSEFTYASEGLQVCSQCFHEWNVEEQKAEQDSHKVLDAYGNELTNGDTVMVIKNLPVKGAAGSIKVGTKVKNIRLTEGGHNIDCKIDGFGAMALKSEYVKKV